MSGAREPNRGAPAEGTPAGGSSAGMRRVGEVGVPVRSVNRAGLYPGTDSAGRPIILGTMSQQAAGFFLLVVDPQTGRFRHLQCPNDGANYTTAVYPSRSGRLYIGAAHSGELYCYDPAAESLVNLGVISGDDAIFPCRIDEDSTGRIWISSYPGADLTSYEPASGQFTRYGRLDEVDMYAYCYVNTDDSIASHIKQTRPHVVVLDPSSGRGTTVGPIIDRDKGELSLFRGVDGRLYIDSSDGAFRVEGGAAVPVASLPEEAQPPHLLSDGTTFRYLDAAEHQHRTLEVTPPEGERRVFHLDYQAAGTDIFCLHGGPDGKVYGSSILPEHFFRFDPATGATIDFGVCSESSGEAYSMANRQGEIYIASYPGARVSIYDPKKPYRFGTDAAANPRDIGRLDDISYRPRSALAGPAGKVWFASLPDYGMWGGPLAYYDPATATTTSFKRICGDASCYTLAWPGDASLLLVGTTIQGGTGTTPRVDRATMFLFDAELEEKVWEGGPEDAKAFTSLLVIGNGAVVGVSQRESGEALFRFDAGSRRLASVRPAPAGGVGDNGLVLGPGGLIYALTRTGVFEIDPESLDHRPVIEFEEPIRGHLALGPIIDGVLYYGDGHRLMACRLSQSSDS